MTKTLQSQLGLADHRTVAGFAVDQAHLDRILVVEILADGQPFAVVRADRFCPALVKEGVTNAQTNHGFVAMLPERLIATTRKISARLANLKTAVGKPIDLERTPPADPQLAAAGGIDGVQGLVVSGWVKAAPGSALLLRAHRADLEQPHHRRRGASRADLSVAPTSSTGRWSPALDQRRHASRNSPGRHAAQIRRQGGKAPVTSAVAAGTHLRGDR